MLQIKYIRENVEHVKERLLQKNFQDIFIVDEIIKLDAQVRELKVKTEKEVVSLSLSERDFQAYKRNNKITEAENKRLQIIERKKANQVLIDQLKETEKLVDNLLLKLPNLPHSSVPKGKTPEDNEVVREGGIKPSLPASAVPHWDLIKKYALVDFETGAKLTGSGFPLYSGKGAKLQRALIQYFLDYNTEAGYTEYLPPLMVNEASAYGTGQLPDKEGQMYHINPDGFYLIPTSEVPLTNIYRDEIIKETDLPVCMTAYTPCFRREAGSFGSDVRGLNRVHQFDKVEIVQLVHPDKSYEVLEDMVAHIEKLLQALELPYRILRLCGGDMSFTSALTYDFEVYSAAQKKWLEVSSVSNFETFQTNRMKIRFKPASPGDRDGDSKTQLLHSLNGSSLALPRIVACLLENNQTEKEINLPKVLHDYFGEKTIH